MADLLANKVELITDEEFEAGFKCAIHMGERLIGEEPDESMPYLFVHYRDFNGPDADPNKVVLAMCALAVDVCSWDDKTKVLGGLAVKAYREKQLPVAVFFVAEARTNQGHKDKPHVQPFDDPESTECAMIMGSRMGQGKHAVCCTVPLKVNEETGLFERAGENRIHRGDDEHVVTAPLLDLYWRAYCMEAFKHGPPK